jgi:acyl-CoA thioester hydrolase
LVCFDAPFLIDLVRGRPEAEESSEDSQVKFSIELPVQFRDIDVMGHVNNATYLQYMETARVELARKLGQVREGFRAGFIVASVRVEFKKPIRDERRITVSVWVSRIGDRSWDLDYSVRGPRKAEYAIGRTTQVAYDYKTRSAVQISGRLKRELAKRVEAPVKFRETG